MRLRGVCSTCDPFNERDTTHYKLIGQEIHSAIGLMSQYPQFAYPEVTDHLKAALRLWHRVPVKKRLTDGEKAIYPTWNTPHP